ncbi:hypothetical protein DXG01_006778 [Tephrocybe rancida]|nr:hypothetical protein DXG01_006778 [Tephrocybe rancida]
MSDNSQLNTTPSTEELVAALSLQQLVYIICRGGRHLRLTLGDHPGDATLTAHTGPASVDLTATASAKSINVPVAAPSVPDFAPDMQSRPPSPSTSAVVVVPDAPFSTSSASPFPTVTDSSSLFSLPTSFSFPSSLAPKVPMPHAFVPASALVAPIGAGPSLAGPAFVPHNATFSSMPTLEGLGSESDSESEDKSDWDSDFEGQESNPSSPVSPTPAMLAIQAAHSPVPRSSVHARLEQLLA